MASSDKPQRSGRPWLIALVVVNMVGIALFLVFRLTCDTSIPSDMCPEVVLNALIVFIVFAVDLFAIVVFVARFAIRVDRRNRLSGPNNLET